MRLEWTGWTGMDQRGGKWLTYEAGVDLSDEDGLEARWRMSWSELFWIRRRACVSAESVV